MTQINNPQVLRKVGVPTPIHVIYKSESHKLHQAFPVKKTEGVPAVVIPGMPVKLNTDGTIQPYTGEGIYLGIAVTDSINPCYPEGALGPEVTVMVEAFAVVYGKAGEASLACGAVLPEAKDSDDTDPYVSYVADDEEDSATAASPKFIAITPGTAEGDLIQVLIR